MVIGFVDGTGGAYHNRQTKTPSGDGYINLYLLGVVELCEGVSALGG